MQSEINQARPMMIHIDLNSCFASIEQQSRPLLRGRPVAVVNRRTEKTAVVTASYEAKQLGVKVGMKYLDAKLLCPDLVALESDPPKYRYVYRRLKEILSQYSPISTMKSIDEGIIDMAKAPVSLRERDMLEVGQEIKQRILDEIGDYMRSNVGIGTNRFLAKMAAGMNKPDGLTLVDASSLKNMYQQLELEDLTGIATGYGRRLRQVGIMTPLEFLAADVETLEKVVFKSKCGRDWHKRLRGWEVDRDEFGLKSVGRQFVLDERGLGYDETLRRFYGLSEDVAVKLRAAGVYAKGARIYTKTYHRGVWQNFTRVDRGFNDEATLFSLVRKLFRTSLLPAYEIGVTCYGLVSPEEVQLDLFGEMEQKTKLVQAVDSLQRAYGSRIIHSAETIGLDGRMSRKVPFGSTRFL